MKNDLEKIQELQEISDRAKYGEKDFDQISLAYKVSKEKGDIWCSENTKRYLDRFTRPLSTKKDNLSDLVKARNYLNRMIEFNSNPENIEKYKIKTKEIIE